MKPGIYKIIIGLLLLGAGNSLVSAQAKLNIHPLLSNQRIERTLRVGEIHSYKIKLKAGKYFRVDVDQRGIDVMLSMSGPDGKVFAERDRPNGSSGQESLSFIAAISGEYQLDLKSFEEKADIGKYEIKSYLPRIPTNQDNKQIEAETLFQEGLRLNLAENLESVEQACEKYEIAAALWHEIGDKYAEALTYTSLGYSRESLDEIEKAIVAHETALELYEKLRSKSFQAISLTALCRLSVFLQKFDIAIERYRQAKAIYRELKDDIGGKELNEKFNNVADAYFKRSVDLARKQESEAFRESLKYLAIALDIYRALEDKEWEALTLSTLGRIIFVLGEKRKALDYYSQALPLLQAIGDISGAAAALRNIGSVYNSLGEKQTALDYLTQSLSLFKEVDNREAKLGEADVLNMMGLIYDSLGEKQKAIDYYNQSLPLYKGLEDKNGEATALNNIGVVYTSLGETQKALDYFIQVLPVMRLNKNKLGEATTLNNFGAVYDNLGEKQKALDYYQQALPLYRDVKDKSGEATILNNIGKINYSSGKWQIAIDYYNQALSLWQEEENKSGQSRTLANIGSAYSALGEGQKALDYNKQALTLSQSIGDKSSEATILSNMGSVYDDLGATQKALDNYSQALLLRKIVGDKWGEAITLNMLINFYEFKNPRLAVFYSKQSVNALQQLRSNIQGIDKELQKTFLKSVEAAYRYLASLLIKQRRFTETQQVLNAFKDQQYFDFNPETLKKVSPLAMTPGESEMSSYYDAASNKVGKIGSLTEQLQRTIGSRKPSVEESTKLQQFEADLKTASDEFSSVIKQADTVFSQPLSDKDIIGEITDTKEMQTVLRDLNSQTGQKVAAIYTLEAHENYYGLLITPDQIIAVSYPIKALALRQKVVKFVGQLSKVDKQANAPKFSESEVQKTAKELYDIVFASVAAKLKELEIKPDVLMWSLDGSLRYIPVSALYDGKQYLAERYRNVVFTRADSERMLAPVSLTWTGTSFYSSKEYIVPVKNSVEGKMKAIRFDGLTNAKTEVETIFGVSSGRGIIDGEFIFNEQFTKESFFKALKLNRPLVHIASHFRFEAGDASSSFLLLGDGNKLTLEDIKSTPDDLFKYVELLTLSACETGDQKERESDGREIDSFAELAQRKGAKAVLASLWKVDDKSTSQLMMQFYQTRQTQKLTKAEALQRAQQSLLKGKNYSHPYYWSPFILIGNWK